MLSVAALQLRLADGTARKHGLLSLARKQIFRFLKAQNTKSIFVSHHLHFSWCRFISRWASSFQLKPFYQVLLSCYSTILRGFNTVKPKIWWVECRTRNFTGNQERNTELLLSTPSHVKILTAESDFHILPFWFRPERHISRASLEDNSDGFITAADEIPPQPNANSAIPRWCV